MPANPNLVRPFDALVRDYGGSGFYNAKHPAIGFKFDGVTDDTAKWGAVVANTGYDLPAGISRVASDVGVTTGVLRFAPGAKIKPASGKTVYLDVKGIQAGPHQHIFDLSDGGEVLIVSGINPVFPEWWGAPSVPNYEVPSEDASFAFDAAARSALQGGAGEIWMNRRSYLVANLEVPGHGLKWISPTRRGAVLVVPSYAAAFKLPSAARGDCYWQNFLVIGETAAQGVAFDFSAGGVLSGARFMDLYLKDLEYSFFQADGGFFSNEVSFCEHENAPALHADPGQANANVWMRPRYSSTRSGVAAFECTATNGNNVQNKMAWPIFEGNRSRCMVLRDQLQFALEGRPYFEADNLDEDAFPWIDILEPTSYTTEAYKVLEVEDAYVNVTVGSPQIFVGSSEAGPIYAEVQVRGNITPGHTLVDYAKLVAANNLQMKSRAIVGAASVSIDAGGYVGFGGAGTVAAGASDDLNLGNGGDTGRLAVRRIIRHEATPPFADNAAAIAGGLAVGEEYYQTGTGQLFRRI